VATPIEIPERSVFRAPEVCEMADVQPYVLRTWEAEFTDLGVAKTAGGPRLYRRADVERVLRIKHLLFVDGLTMAGVRRRLSEEAPAPAPEPIVEGEWVEAVDVALRERLRDVRGGLQSILSLLSSAPQGKARKASVNGSGRGAAKGKSAAKRSATSKTAARPKPAKAKPVAKSKPKAASRPKSAAAKAKSKPKRAAGAKKR